MLPAMPVHCRFINMRGFVSNWAARGSRVILRWHEDGEINLGQRQKRLNNGKGSGNRGKVGGDTLVEQNNIITARTCRITFTLLMSLVTWTIMTRNMTVRPFQVNNCLFGWDKDRPCPQDTRHSQDQENSKYEYCSIFVFTQLLVPELLVGLQRIFCFPILARIQPGSGRLRY